ncbi:MAG: hypothetical protein EXR50_00860 [Dehalococcoidia bacterium]|nr:hypothetical protein [Dehalococcoidia bacterium]
MALSAFVGLVVLFLIGYAASPFLLPKPWRVWRILLAPALGLVVFSVISYWASMFVPMGLAIWPVLGAAVIGSSWAFLYYRRLGPAVQRVETALVAGMAALAFVVAVMPSLIKTDLLATGPNWDFEIYLPMAEYLEEYPLGLTWDKPAGQSFATSEAEAQAHSNPLLWRVNFFDTRWAGLAFSLFQAGVDSLGSLEAHQSFSALLALVYACSVPAVYVFCRSALQMRTGLGLASVGLTAINSSALFAVFWSFGQHASSLAVLPLSLAAAIEAHKRPGVRSCLFAGLSLSALLNCFTPAAIIYASIVVPVFVFRLAITRRLREIGWTASALLFVSVICNPFGYLRTLIRGYHFLSESGAAGLTTGPDVSKYVAISWGYGLIPEQTSGSGGAIAGQLPGLTEISILLAGIALLFTVAAALKKRDYVFISCALGAFTLLVLLRWPLGYPYGYLKLLPSLAFILVGVAVSGFDAVLLNRILGRYNKRSALRWAAAGLSLIYVIVTVTGTIGALRKTVEDSTLAYRPLEEISRQVDPGSSVYMPFHQDLQGPKAAAAAYFLRDAQLYGQVRTGYSTFYRLSTNGSYDFALLSERDGHLGEVIDRKNEVWRGSGLILYRWKPDITVYREFGPPAVGPVVEASGGRGKAAGLRIVEWDHNTGYPGFSGWSPPLLGALAGTSEGGASYPAATPGNAIIIGASASTSNATEKSVLNLELQGLQGDEKNGVLTVTLAATRPTKLEVNMNKSLKELNLPAGVSSHTIGRANGQATISLSHKEGRVYLKSLYMSKAADQAADGMMVEQQNMAVLEWTASYLSPSKQTINISYAGPSLKPVLDVYRSPEEENWHLGYWEIPVSAPSRWDVNLVLDPINKSVTDTSDGRPIAGWVNPSPPGNYIAYLFLWDGPSVSKSVALTDFDTTDSHTTPPITPAEEGVFIG